MSLAVVHSRGQQGVHAPAVEVEVHLSHGLPSLSIVGLAETAVKESKDRVRGALLSSGFEFPVGRITVNLAPADLPKEGGRFDLPIAIGILAASGQVSTEHLVDLELVGELALSGEIRAISGVLGTAVSVSKQQRALVTSPENAEEAALVSALTVYGAKHLLDVTAFLQQQTSLRSVEKREPPRDGVSVPDLADVRGQQSAKRALTIAAAGGHSLLIV
jgi:magnesium chelatase family protein